MAINQDDIIYFLLTDRFYRNGDSASLDGVDPSKPKHYHGGNFEGIIEKIPYLKNLGVTALWITPVYLQIPDYIDPTEETVGNSGYGYHGYWTLDFNQVDPHLYIKKDDYPQGSKWYVRDLVKSLHDNGIKFIMDIVVNHTGYKHPGFINQGDNPTPINPSWFNPASAEDEIEGQLAKLPDFDLDSPNVADYHIQSILSWIKETGVDGIRMDTAKHVERIFWQYYKTQVAGLHPDVNLIGEVLDERIEYLSQYQKYWAFDNLFDFPLGKAIEDVFGRGESLTRFVTPYNQGHGILSTIR